MLQIIFSEYPTACSTKEIDESITYFQIQDKNGNALESGLKEIFFSPNENKDSQFWYLQKQPNSDFGYIGSKLYYDNYRVLSVSSSPCKYGFFVFIRYFMLSNVQPVFQLLGDESGWGAVENFKNTCTPFYCKPSTEDVKEHQMWRLDENSNIVSEFNNGILGVNEDNALATYSGDEDMVGAVKIVEQYKTVNSSYELAVQGKYNLVEVLRMQVSILLTIVLA